MGGSSLPCLPRIYFCKLTFQLKLLLEDATRFKTYKCEYSESHILENCHEKVWWFFCRLQG